ncbi:MAG: hypothetical protein JEY99_00420 [Spirochaetales bacterium]|nr:hypothetical protein [Spirochaetales bacterium]
MNNSSNISFGFRELTDVPVFVSLLFSFILGVLFALPVAYFEKKSRKVRKKKSVPVEDEVYKPDYKDQNEKKDKKKFSIGNLNKKKKKTEETGFEKKDSIS